MAIDEEARHALYEAFKATHGDRVANTLMELLPPVGWAELASKHDLAALEQRMDLRLERLEARLGERLESALRQQAARFWVGLVTVAGLSLGIAEAFSRLG